MWANSSIFRDSGSGLWFGTEHWCSFWQHFLGSPFYIHLLIFQTLFRGYPALTVPANIKLSMFFCPAPLRPSDIRECKTSSMGHYFTQLANSLRFSFPLRSYSGAPGCLKHELLYAEADPGVKERTADSQLPTKITSHSKNCPRHTNPRKSRRSRPKNPGQFLCGSGFHICIRIRAYQLADAERAGFSAQHVNQTSLFSQFFSRNSWVPALVKWENTSGASHDNT